MRWLGFKRGLTPDNLRRSVRDPAGGRQCYVPLRGVVHKVYAAKTSSGGANVAGGAPDVPDPISSVLCDVEIIEPGWRGLLRAVPMMKSSGGTWDHEHFRPRPMGQKITGGTLILEGGPQATPRDQADGDYVVVQFLGGDLTRPIIIGQLAHPGTLRPYHEYSGYRFVRWLAGVRIGVANDGSVELDMSAATKDSSFGQTWTDAIGGEAAGTVKATIIVSDSTSIVIEDGKVHIEGAVLTVKNSEILPVQPVLLEAMMTDVGSLLTEWFPLIQTIAAIFGVPLPNTPAVLAGLISGTGPSGAYKAADTEST